MIKAYLAFDGFIDELKHELTSGAQISDQMPNQISGDGPDAGSGTASKGSPVGPSIRTDSIISVYDHLIVAHAPAHPVYWAQNIWNNPREIAVESIGDAAKKLRALGGLWAMYPFGSIRRATLIEEKLPPLRKRDLNFLQTPQLPALGSWTLLKPDLLLASPSCTSAFPNGAMHFVEDKESPPSRAYLKLWEAFTLHSARPLPGERVIDMGSSPGGWTWVLQSMGCSVISVDRAELDPSIAKLPNVEFISHSAFTLDPKTIGKVDWFFSDIICEPRKLYDLVERWRAAGVCSKFICTIKFKGETDFETTRLFAQIPGSRIVHLYHNKHELTWICA